MGRNRREDKVARTSGMAGFSLLEVLVVMCIIITAIGISAYYATPRGTDKKLDWAAYEMASYLRQARTSVIKGGTSKTIIFDLDSGTYGPAEGPSRKVPAGFGIGIKDSFAGDIFKGKYSMVFHAGGWIEGGDVLVWNRKRTIIIKLDPVAGFINVQK